MAESPSESTSDSPTTTSSNPPQSTTVAISSPQTHHAFPDIPVEIVSEEEMAILDAALAATRSILPSAIRSPSSSRILSGGSPKTIRSITIFSKRKLSACSSDIEDSYLRRFRRNQALGVTDITSTEWCEKQMENLLCFGRRKVTKAMKRGQARHLKLEEEVVKKVRVRVESNEDKWALKLLSSIAGVNQFLSEGRTRELLLLGFVGGQWIVGIIDEVRMASQESSDSGPLLSDTKTRVRDTLPAEPQRRNGRLQVMLYKLLWDTIVKEGFPAGRFFDYFSLNRHYILSQDVRDNVANAGIPAQTLEEIVRYYENTFKMLPIANDQLLLRYEFQKDQSTIAEIRFPYDPEWVMSKYREAIEFWRSEREAEYTPEEERWKCRFCQFAKSCPGNPSLESPTPSSPPRETPPLVS